MPSHVYNEQAQDRVHCTASTLPIMQIKIKRNSSIEHVAVSDPVAERLPPLEGEVETTKDETPDGSRPPAHAAQTGKSMLKHLASPTHQRTLPTRKPRQLPRWTLAHFVSATRTSLPSASRPPPWPA